MASSWSSWGSSLVASVTTAVGTVADKAKQGAATLKETAARQVAEVMAEGDEGSASKAGDVLPWEAAPARYRDEMKEVILKLSSDNRTFTSDPPAEVEFAFDFASNADAATALLAQDPNLSEVRFKLVPRTVKEARFWRNYFYRVSVIQDSFRIRAETEGEEVTEQEPGEGEGQAEGAAAGDGSKDTLEAAGVQQATPSRAAGAGGGAGAGAAADGSSGDAVEAGDGSGAGSGGDGGGGGAGSDEDGITGGDGSGSGSGSGDGGAGEAVDVDIDVVEQDDGAFEAALQQALAQEAEEDTGGGDAVEGADVDWDAKIRAELGLGDDDGSGDATAGAGAGAAAGADGGLGDELDDELDLTGLDLGDDDDDVEADAVAQQVQEVAADASTSAASVTPTGDGSQGGGAGSDSNGSWVVVTDK